jgi:hypothetical protein
MPRAKDPASDTAATMRSGVVTRLMPATPVKFQDACESDEGATLPVLTLVESAYVAEGGTGLTLCSKLWCDSFVSATPCLLT